MLCGQAARGGCYRTTCRHGGRFTAGSPPGATTGCFERINHALVMADRERVGRYASPTAAIIDSQSAKTTEAGGPRGYDAGKKINGRKRHALVDTDGRGLVLERIASIQDRDGGGPLLRISRRIFLFIERVFADSGYAGEKVTTATLIAVEIVRKNPDQVGFAVNPRRWVVERFFAWIGRNRRLAKDFEATIDSARAFLYAASVMLLVRRIARASPRRYPASEAPKWGSANSLVLSPYKLGGEHKSVRSIRLVAAAPL